MAPLTCRGQCPFDFPDVNAKGRDPMAEDLGRMWENRWSMLHLSLTQGEKKKTDVKNVTL